MGRDSEFKQKTTVGINLEKEEKDALKEIALRETGGDMSPIARKAILEYIKNHGEGNDTFKLEGWIENPEFQAVPTLFADYEKWTNYYKDSNPQDRLKVRISLVRIFNMIKGVEFDEGVRVKDIK